MGDGTFCSGGCYLKLLSWGRRGGGGGVVYLIIWWEVPHVMGMVLMSRRLAP